MNRLAMTAALAMAGSTAFGLEPVWLQVTVSGTLQAHGTLPDPGDFAGVSAHRYGVTLWGKFDAEAPPTDLFPGLTTFSMADFELTVVPLAPGDDEVRVYTPENAAGGVWYSETFDRLQVNVLAFGATQAGMSLFVDAPAGVFNVGMETLPDDPADYAFAGGDDEEIRLAFSGTFGGGYARWTPTEGYEQGTSIGYMVAETTAPAPRPCSEADLAEPFGVLNLDDLDAFVAQFLGGCP